MPETYWVDGVPYERETPQEREERIQRQKEEKKNKKKRKLGEIPKYVKGRKEGMDLENRVVSRWNSGMNTQKKEKTYNVKKRLSALLEEEAEEEVVPQSGVQVSPNFSTKTPVLHPRKRTPSEPEAKRQPNSGALWFAKGDVQLEHALVEVKERGTVNGRGEKTISIPKEWLTKQEEEAFQENRDYWYIAFAYKGDQEIYLIKPYDHEIEFVSLLRNLQDENDQLKARIQQLEEERKEDEYADS